MQKVCAALCLALSLGACSPSDMPAVSEPVSANPQQKEIPPTVASVRTSLSERNYGLAAEQAEQLVGRPTPSADDWFVAAEARAANGERLPALAALEKAIQSGMQDVGRIESSTHLTELSQSDEYHALLERFGLVKNLATSGDAVVRQRNGAIEVKAGDVSVTLPN